MSVDLKDRVGFHKDADGYWTLKSSTKDLILVTPEGSFKRRNSWYKKEAFYGRPFELLLPLELML